MEIMIPLLSNRGKDEKHYNGSHKKIQRRCGMYGIIQYTEIRRSGILKQGMLDLTPKS